MLKSNQISTTIRPDIHVTDYGATFNGALTLLSSLYSTLAAAQVKYPSATSLLQDTDTLGINAAIAVGKTYTYGFNLIFPSGRVGVIGSGTGTGQGINLTGISMKSVVINGAGSSLIGQTNGAAVIDMLNTNYMRIKDLYIYGYGGSNFCTTGIQMGIGTTGSAAENILENVFIDGYYTLAALYNTNSETSSFYSVRAWNYYNSATCYGLVQDGIFHFNITSQFMTVTRTQNSQVSFNEDSFYACDFRSLSPGTGIPIWVAATYRHKFISCYALNSSSTTGMVLYSYAGGSDNNSFLDLDLHFETTNLTNVFLLSGANASPAFFNFRFRDHAPQPSAEIFKLDTGVTSASFPGVDIQIGTLQSSSVKLVDTPSAYTMSGNIYLYNTTCFNLINWSGMLNQSGTVTYSGALGQLGTAVMQTGIPFVIPSSGSIGNNGALTGITSLPRTISAGAYFYFPTGAISTGSAAGWYWTVMSSATAGTIYNSTYTTGQPEVGTTTAFSTTGPGAYTQSITAVVGPAVSIPGNSMGINGSIETQVLVSCDAATSAKYVIINFGGVQGPYIDTATSTVTTFGGSLSMTNQGVATTQVGMTGTVGGGEFNQTGGSALVTSINTANTQTYELKLQISTAATDFLILERHSVKLFASN